LPPGNACFPDSPCYTASRKTPLGPQIARDRSGAFLSVLELVRESGRVAELTEPLPGSIVYKGDSVKVDAMRISTRARYGLRFMIDLARHGVSGSGSVPLHDVARRQGVSRKYLWQVVSPLRVAGLVSANRGAHGGYELTRPADAITLRDIFEALEGDCGLLDCTRPTGVCPRSGSCVSRSIWGDVEAGIDDVMSRITLEQMVQREDELASAPAADYMI
ncbi:MAG: Rrf2 family transcriptional regulator, partial [Lentisphaeria bacterium]|nr:Rrf2 family transcriptional regulator [Lentisphaeria bacterium]